MRTIIYNPSSKEDFIAKESNNSFYCIIDSNIKLKGDFTFPANSVLDFRGGCYTSGLQESVAINLNGSQVFAPSYCIFGKLVTVNGFNNDSVKAEWFNADGSNRDEQIFINRAIEAAAGCPVVLEDRTYYLSGSIKFANLGVFTRQSLTAPGTLQVTNNEPAIDIDQCSIDLKINKIRGFETTTKPSAKAGGGIIVGPINPITYFNGVGIKFSCNCQHITIDVRQMHFLEYGLMFEPDGTREIVVDGESKSVSGGLQYINIIFQYIHAKYCMYVDIYSHFKYKNVWLSELNVTGGRLRGDYGIYFADRTDEEQSNIIINGLYFSNIAFEGISTLPIRLRNVSSSRFMDLRLSEDLPANNQNGTKMRWIDIDDISFIIMSWKGLVSPNRFVYGSNCRWMIVEGFILDSEAVFSSRFNRIVFTKDYNSKDSHTKMVVTSSIQPFDMCDEIVVKEDKTLFLFDLLPTWSDGTDVLKSIHFDVLPRSLNIVIRENCHLTLDMKKITYFPQCLFNVYAIIEKNGSLKFSADSVENNKSFTESGLYRLTWNSVGQLFITKI